MRRHSRRTLALLCAVSLSWACGDWGGGSSSGGGAAQGTSFGGSSSSGADDVAAFQTTTYPLLVEHCADCHAGSGPGSPHFAAPNVTTAHQAVTSQGKVNLANPGSSRLVIKLVSLMHNCWSDCVSDGATMAAAIQAWADAVDFGGGGVSVEGSLASSSQSLGDAVVDTGSERYAGNLIALYEFKEGAGTTAGDSSPVSPPIDLELQGDVAWMSNWGVDIEDGVLLGSRQASRKLYDRIADPTTGTQQYTVEAWIVPDNVDQEGPARIVSYSRNTGERNFTLGQVQYNYNARNRSISPDMADEGRNGTPALQTEDADQDLQDRLQHVVLTYDQFRGRRIYVDGVFTDDEDPVGAARLWNWSPEYNLALGNEVSRNRLWKGQIRLLAIYQQALTDAQIRQNFEAGVGQRLLLRFGVDPWMGAGSSVEFVVTEYDAYSYLFCLPTLRTSAPNGSRISNLRIAVNGVLAPSGQGFATLDTTSTGTRQELSRQCSVIPKGANGPGGDSFALVFEHLGGFEDVVVENPVDPAPVPLDPEPRPVNGLRDFKRINASFASLTDQDPSVAAATYAEIEEQLPPDHDVRAFVSSQQVAIAKMALDYCDALAEGPERANFFPGFDFGASADVAFDTAAERDLIFDPLYDRMVGDMLAMQPTRAEVRLVLDTLVSQLTATCIAQGNCDATRTRTVVKGACAAVLSSAPVTLH